MAPPTSVPDLSDMLARPSSSSTHIAVDMHSPPEEELFAAAEAMREALRSRSRSKGLSAAKGKGRPVVANNTSAPAVSTTTTATASPPRSASGSSIAHATTTASPARSSSSSSTSISGSIAPPSTKGTRDAEGTEQVVVDDDDDDDDDDDEDDDDSLTSDSDDSNTNVPPTAAATAAAVDHSRYPASMTSSVRDHVYEGGLRYHAYRAGKYAFPNDEAEQNRDDMKHAMTLMLCRGAYFYAPVEDVLEAGGAEVLDLGTGTGIWAMELGDRYPDATFTGVDLSPIQPTFVPENVHFFVDDFEEEWVDPDNKFDFIHLRHTLHSVHDPEALLQRAYRHLKPGGYFEAQELSYHFTSDDGTLTPATPYALRDYARYLGAGLRALGSDVDAVLPLADQMAAAGFEDVHRTTHKCPLGAWPRDERLRYCGLFLRTSIMDGLRGLSRRPLLALGWTPLQIEMFLVEVRKAVADEGVHAYCTLHVVHGRKPVG